MKIQNIKLDWYETSTGTQISELEDKINEIIDTVNQISNPGGRTKSRYTKAKVK